MSLDFFDSVVSCDSEHTARIDRPKMCLRARGKILCAVGRTPPVSIVLIINSLDTIILVFRRKVRKDHVDGPGGKSFCFAFGPTLNRTSFDRRATVKAFSTLDHEVLDEDLENTFTWLGNVEGGSDTGMTREARVFGSFRSSKYPPISAMQQEQGGQMRV